MHAILILSHLSAIAIEQIHVIVIGFVILFTIRTGLAQDYITLFKTERSKTIPCPAAHPHIGYIRY